MAGWDWPSFLIGCVVGATVLGVVFAALIVNLADRVQR
jgi:uncharacterized protein (DUF2062 family)